LSEACAREMIAKVLTSDEGIEPHENPQPPRNTTIPDQPTIEQRLQPQQYIPPQVSDEKAEPSKTENL
uniref:Conjugal transfer protein TraD n=1 Tax=Rodentolepis nana TaxID=102285 RepID=A0A0R3TFI3_RODNA